MELLPSPLPFTFELPWVYEDGFATVSRSSSVSVLILQPPVLSGLSKSHACNPFFSTVFITPLPSRPPYHGLDRLLPSPLRLHLRQLPACVCQPGREPTAPVKLTTMRVFKALRRSIKGDKDTPHVNLAPKSAIAIVPPKKVRDCDRRAGLFFPVGPRAARSVVGIPISPLRPRRPLCCRPH